MKDFPSFYNQGLRNFVSYLLVIEPKDRPSFHEIGKHPIVDEIG
jgi:hypothetical protein